MLISTRYITKIHRTDEVDTAALHAVNLDISPGEFVTPIGHSAHGRSKPMHFRGLIDSASPDTSLFTSMGRFE